MNKLQIILTRTCKECGEEFTQVKKQGIHHYCTQECRAKTRKRVSDNAYVKHRAKRLALQATYNDYKPKFPKVNHSNYVPLSLISGMSLTERTVIKRLVREVYKERKLVKVKLRRADGLIKVYSKVIAVKPSTILKLAKQTIKEHNKRNHHLGCKQRFQYLMRCFHLLNNYKVRMKNGIYIEEGL